MVAFGSDAGHNTHEDSKDANKDQNVKDYISDQSQVIIALKEICFPYLRSENEHRNSRELKIKL